MRSANQCPLFFYFLFFYRPVWFFPDVSSPECWNVVSPLLGEDEVMYFFDSAYCIPLSPHTSIGLPCLHVWHFRCVLFYESHLNCSLFPNVQPSFRNICVDGVELLVYFMTMSVCSLYGVEWYDYLSVTNWEGFRRKRSWPILGNEENYKTLIIGIFCVPVEIRTVWPLKRV
jgi:hypothetical protein